MTGKQIDKPAKLCIYHANCMDGFTAAWVFWRFCRQNGTEVEFLPAAYGDAPPEVIGRDVVIVDFSYPLQALEHMMAVATSVTLLDHHKSAQEDLSKLNVRDNSMVEFDMERSGAGLAWDTFFHGTPRPKLVDYVEDRDLWRFDHKFTKVVHACLSSQEPDFEMWERIMEALETPEGLATIGIEGAAILRKHDRDVVEIVQSTRRTMVIGGHLVPVANVPPCWASDAGHLMAKDPGVPFSATYFDMDGARKFSLRSHRHEGHDLPHDVSAVAKQYGGGGHRPAAGFTAPQGWEGEQPLGDG